MSRRHRSRAEEPTVTRFPLADWNKLTEEADHPIQPAPKAQATKGQKNKAKQKTE